MVAATAASEALEGELASRQSIMQVPQCVMPMILLPRNVSVTASFWLAELACRQSCWWRGTLRLMHWPPSGQGIDMMPDKRNTGWQSSAQQDDIFESRCRSLWWRRCRMRQSRLMRM